MDALVDRYGRVMDDLRLSVTDRCNFRCVYCMPAEGLPWLAREEVLSYEELTRLAGLFVRRLGTRTIRLTGGEPLVRRDLATLVRALRTLGPDLDLALTTNGVLLADQAAKLAAAGLDRVNVSLDTLRRETFEAITRRDDFDRVLAGLAAADAAGLGPIKVNCVVMKGCNDTEVVDFARWGRALGYQVRFIEYMPLDAQDAWQRGGVTTMAEMLEALEEEVGVVGPVGPPGPEPATVFELRGGGEVGFIPSVSKPFCRTCNRGRVTADGQFRSCLFSVDELDLKGLLRGGADDDEIERAVRAWVWDKWDGGAIRILRRDFVKPARSMSQIGG